MAAPRVFFSYAGDDGYWVDLFRPYFVRVLKTVSILDYSADTIGYGPLSAALDAQIEGSAVVLAFVSKNYQEKQWTVAEWEKSLSEVQRRRLIFVPIMLDADGLAWWQKLQRENRLTALTRDYQFEDFTTGGEPALPGPDTPRVIQKINSLALQVRKDIQPLEAIAPLPPGPAPTPPPHEAKVVVLGHPSASFPEDLEGDEQQLIAALGASAVTWADGWRKKDAARATIPPEADPVFVQPITDGESADYIEDRTKANKYLAEAQRPKARVAIWLPARYSDAEFEKAANASIAPRGAGESDKQAFPALRMDTPDDLAKWLRAEVDGVTSTSDRTVVQVEGFGTGEGAKPETALAAKLTVDHLTDTIFGIVSGAVQKPPPARPWQFWATQFARQIKTIEGRAIVAIHDLNITQSSDARFVRKQVELKFDSIQTAVELEQRQRAKDHRPCLKLFWTALLVNNAGILPFSNYPDDGRYKDWRLLEFWPDEHSEGGSRAIPDAASLAVFRTNLLAWAAEP
jgi:hypothetical protein